MFKIGRVQNFTFNSLTNTCPVLSSYSGQGVVHGGKLRAKGRGAWVCLPGWWGTKRLDLARPLSGQVPLHRRRQECLLGMGLELRHQEGVELLVGERVREMMLLFPSFTPFSSPPSVSSPLSPSSTSICESSLARDRRPSSFSSSFYLFSSSTFFLLVCLMQITWNPWATGTFRENNPPLSAFRPCIYILLPDYSTSISHPSGWQVSLSVYFHFPFSHPAKAGD